MMWSVYLSAIELPVRVAAHVVGLFKKNHRYVAERIMRGALLGFMFGSRGLVIGRVQIESPARCHFGNNVRLYCGSVLVSGSKGNITIGDRTHLGYKCVLSGSGGITIGSNCAISSSVIIYSVTNVPMLDSAIVDSRRNSEVVIEDNVFIGMGVQIVPGVRIGEGAVIAAGATVTTDVGAGLVVGGTPAKVIKTRHFSESQCD